MQIQIAPLRNPFNDNKMQFHSHSYSVRFGYRAPNLMPLRGQSVDNQIQMNDIARHTINERIEINTIQRKEKKNEHGRKMGSI